jgi:hypothetical protein
MDEINNNEFVGSQFESEIIEFNKKTEKLNKEIIKKKDKKKLNNKMINSKINNKNKF